jgi:hypothetical protein
MVDVLVSFCYGYRLGAVSEMDPSTPWSSPPELCTAIALFPLRGVLVSSLCAKTGVNVMQIRTSNSQRSAVPVWAWKLLCRIPNKRWRQMCDSDKVMAEVIFPSFLDRS